MMKTSQRWHLLLLVVLMHFATVHGLPTASAATTRGGNITVTSYPESLTCNGDFKTYSVAPGACIQHGQGIPGAGSSYTCQPSASSTCVEATNFQDSSCTGNPLYLQKSSFVCGVCMSDSTPGYMQRFDCGTNSSRGTAAQGGGGDMDVTHWGKCNSDCSHCKERHIATNSSACLEGDSGNWYYTYRTFDCPAQQVTAEFYGSSDGTCNRSTPVKFVMPSGKCQIRYTYTC